MNILSKVYEDNKFKSVNKVIDIDLRDIEKSNNIFITLLFSDNDVIDISYFDKFLIYIITRYISRREISKELSIINDNKDLDAIPMKNLENNNSKTIIIDEVLKNKIFKHTNILIGLPLYKIISFIENKYDINIGYIHYDKRDLEKDIDGNNVDLAELVFYGESYPGDNLKIIVHKHNIEENVKNIKLQNIIDSI